MVTLFDSDVKNSAFVSATDACVGAKVFDVLSELCAVYSEGAIVFSVGAKVSDVLVMSNCVDLCISEKTLGLMNWLADKYIYTR